jgi:hypothetical protein
VSRQDDRALAIVLFGDRLAAADLVLTGSPHSVLADIPVYTDLLILADRIGVNIVDGK